MRRLARFALACLAGSAVAGMAQTSSQEAALPRVSYSFDPVHAVVTAATGASFVIPGKVETEPAAAATPETTYTGTVVVIFKVKLVSPVPKGAVLRCGGSAGLEYLVQEQVTTNIAVGGFTIVSNAQTVNATISNGTATCKLTLPYSWTIPMSTPKITVSVNGVSGLIGISETMVEATDTVNTVVTLRSTTAGLTGPNLPPPDGETIVLQANAVL